MKSAKNWVGCGHWLLDVTERNILTALFSMQTSHLQGGSHARRISLRRHLCAARSCRPRSQKTSVANTMYVISGVGKTKLTIYSNSAAHYLFAKMTKFGLFGGSTRDATEK